MASTYLTRTASGGSNQIYTTSCWVKRTGLGASTTVLSTGNGTADNNARMLFIDANDKIEISYYNAGYTYEVTTNRVLRDTSAWYHLVVAVDTTQATASDRIKIWVNGVQETSFETSSYPSLNATFNYNSSAQYIGDLRGSGIYSDFVLSHLNYIDGTAYDADTFGETDATTGIWKPKTAPSVTYGTNGFFLKFENSGAFGTDSSGNGNNFTVNGTMTQTIDTPSNVFATWNPLMKPSSASTFSNGNLTVTNGTNSVYPYSVSNQGFSQGKWYAEFKYTPSGNAGQIGIMDLEIATTNFQANNVGSSSNGCITYQYNGNIIGNGTVHSTGHTSLSSGDIVGVAVDEDNQLIYFYVNGTLQNSGGTDYSGDAFTSGFVGFYCGDASGGGTDTWEANFGNGYFGTTAVSSAQNPDDGIGIFEYDVPTGYRALCTKSINAQEYS
jgi:hypothetical protein